MSRFFARRRFWPDIILLLESSSSSADLAPTQAKLAKWSMLAKDSIIVPRCREKKMLQQVRQWPSVAPTGHVMATNEEWYEIVQRALRLGHGDTVVEADIFRDQCVSTVKLLRCISNLVPMSACLRRLQGDSSLLPSASRLGLVVPVQGETLGSYHHSSHEVGRRGGPTRTARSVTLR